MYLAQFVHRYPPALGGAESYIARLTDRCRQLGDHVTVWTSTALQLEEFWNGAAPATSLSAELRRYQPIAFPLRRYLLKALTLLPSARLRAFVLPCNPIMPGMWRDVGRYDGPLDAVHATAFPYAWPMLCARRLARRRGVPFLLTPFLHLGDARTAWQYTQPALRWLLLDADRVFVHTHLEREAVLKLGVPSQKVVLQGLGVNPVECTGGERQRFRNSLGIQHDEFVIGHLANLSHEKGSVDLVQACRRLWANGWQFRLLLAGPDMANFRRLMANVPKSPRLRTLGPLSESARNDFYAAIDAFALPSRCDAFGLVLLEAWANGVPCVAYRAGGPGEIIQHGRDGLLAACGDVSDLGRQLLELLRHPAMARRLGKAGQERARREFDWQPRLELFRATVRACLSDCLNPRRPAAPTATRSSPSARGSHKSAAWHRCG